MSKPTIREVARLCNVSVSTVSRVLNDLPDVNETTKKKVWEVIHSCGYIPNSSARMLKQLSSKIICIIVKGMQNPFYTPIVEQIQNEIDKTKYIPLLQYIGESEDEADIAVHLIEEKKAIGVIFIGGSPLDKKQKLENIQIPCVFSTMSAEGLKMKNVSSICIDEKKSMQKSVKHLLNMGHRNIAILGGQLISREDLVYKRYTGAVECLREYGLPCNEHLYISSKFTFEDSYNAVADILKMGEPDFTAVAAMSDTMAIGACRAIFDFGFSVPHDISVVGFDGIAMTRFYNPVITTIRQPSKEIAHQSVIQLLGQIEGWTEAKNIILETDMVAGKSVKRLL